VATVSSPPYVAHQHADDVFCTCGCFRECHRVAMEWGERVRTACRHCRCERFVEGAAPPPKDPLPTPPALAAYEAYACPECGARYGQRFTDHDCGPLVPVTVTITRREVALRG
jgi:hypothetical protein